MPIEPSLETSRPPDQNISAVYPNSSGGKLRRSKRFPASSNRTLAPPIVRSWAMRPPETPEPMTTKS